MNLNAPPPFNMSETWNLGPRWRKWIRKFENFVALSGASESMQLNLLLHCVGPEVENLIDTFTQEEREDVTKMKQALNACFEPKKDLQYLRYQFHSAKQGTNESMKAFKLRLTVLAMDCDFDKYSAEEAIQSQVIVGCSSPTERNQLLGKTAEKKGIQQEETMQVDVMKESTKEHVYKDQGHEMQEVSHLSRPSTKKAAAQCDRCGMQWPYDGQCPAIGHTCRSCGKENHYQSVCRSKTAPGTAGNKPGGPDTRIGTPTQKSTDNHMQKQKSLSSRSPSPSVGYVGGMQFGNKKGGLRLIVEVANKPIECLISTGSTINVVDFDTYRGLSPLPPLRPTNMKIYSLTGPLLSCRGKFDVQLAYGDKVVMSEMFVLNDLWAVDGYLIGNVTIEEMRMVIFSFSSSPEVNDQQESGA